VASGFCLTIAVVGAFCFRERAENKGTWPINPLPETPYASGFPVKPIILGKIIGFGVNGFNERGSPYPAVSVGCSGSGL
jgi:hypothetical protein